MVYEFYREKRGRIKHHYTLPCFDSYFFRDQKLLRRTVLERIINRRKQGLKLIDSLFHANQTMTPALHYKLFSQNKYLEPTKIHWRKRMKNQYFMDHHSQSFYCLAKCDILWDNGTLEYLKRDHYFEFIGYFVEY